MAMTEDRPDLERLLTDALRPIEPPEDLSGRVETTLSAVTEAAATELADWADELSEGELAALRDPRNWIRPVAAVAAGGVAGSALVALELRRRRRRVSELGALSGMRAVAASIRSRLD